jgi:uncharacterized zinc-type alcohol dehydrogenase-like protein
MIPAKAIACPDSTGPLGPIAIERLDPGPKDVVIDIQFCGICHSDLHIGKNELGRTKYPFVPGHEIVGVVASVGAEVTQHKVGDRVGVGCMVDSDRTCHECQRGEEQFCTNMVGTYGGTDKAGRPTMGGYSDKIVVNEHFVLRIPDALSMAAAAPLLCAGITTWSPLKTWEAGPGKKVGVVGLGGLGHMAVKLAAALGAEVTVLSTSDRKKADALAMGAHDFLVTTDAEAMKSAVMRFDLIINTVSAPADVNRLIQLLGRDGTMVMLGLAAEPLPVFSLALLSRRRRLAGSPIGGIRETQEMLDFCAEHGIVSDIELIKPEQINEAWARIEKSDVRYRFVIDMAGL